MSDPVPTQALGLPWPLSYVALVLGWEWLPMLVPTTRWGPAWLYASAFVDQDAEARLLRLGYPVTRPMERGRYAGETCVTGCLQGDRYADACPFAFHWIWHLEQTRCWSTSIRAAGIRGWFTPKPVTVDRLLQAYGTGCSPAGFRDLAGLTEQLAHARILWVPRVDEECAR